MLSSGRNRARAILALSAIVLSSAPARTDQPPATVRQPVVQAVTRGAASAPQKERTTVHSKKSTQPRQRATSASPVRANSPAPRTAGRASIAKQQRSKNETAALASLQPPQVPPESSRVTRPLDEQPAPEPRCVRLPPGPDEVPSFVAILGSEDAANVADPVLEQPESEQVRASGKASTARPAKTGDRQQAAPRARVQPRSSTRSRQM